MCHLEESDYVLVEDTVRTLFTRIFGEKLVSLVLFGSYARRDASCNSDIDLLVIVEDSVDRLEAHRLIDIVEQELNRSLEPLKLKGANPVLSPHILPKSLAVKPRPLYLDIVFDAKILVDKRGIMSKTFDEIKKSLKKLGAKRVRLGNGWVLVLKDRVEPGEKIKIW